MHHQWLIVVSESSPFQTNFRAVAHDMGYSVLMITNPQFLYAGVESRLNETRAVVWDEELPLTFRDAMQGRELPQTISVFVASSYEINEKPQDIATCHRLLESLAPKPAWKRERRM